MSWPSFDLLAQAVLAGVFIGSLYGLLGLGLSLSWGMLNQINLAHFALAFLGAYLTYQWTTTAGVDPFLTLCLILPLFFLMGVLMHALFTRFKVSVFNSLLVNFGLTVIIDSLIQYIWTADYRKLETPYATMKFSFAGLYFPLPELLTLCASVGLSLATWAILRHTRAGKALRAISMDPLMARAFGIPEGRLTHVLAGAAAAMAGLAGVCIALSFTLAPSQIYLWIGVIFAAVMIGGLGNPWGPLWAGLVIGVSESVTMAVSSPAWAPLVSFSLLIGVLLLRPGKL
jgi:branched-chain amino acid transport system permease protein